jgi:hypothetical protein
MKSIIITSTSGKVVYFLEIDRIVELPVPFVFSAVAKKKKALTFCGDDISLPGRYHEIKPPNLYFSCGRGS